MEARGAGRHSQPTFFPISPPGVHLSPSIDDFSLGAQHDGERYEDGGRERKGRGEGERATGRKRRRSRRRSFRLVALPENPPPTSTAEETYGSPLADPIIPHSPPASDTETQAAPPSEPPPARGTATARVWREIFHPGSPHVSTGRHGADYYDSAADTAGGSVWDEVLKSERLAAAAKLAREANDPLVDAAALKRELGGGAEVDALIAAADVKGDGRIEFGAFKRALSLGEKK